MHIVRVIYATRKDSAARASVLWHVCCALNPFSMEIWCHLVSCVTLAVRHGTRGEFFVWYQCQVKFVNFVNKSLRSNFAKREIFVTYLKQKSNCANAGTCWKGDVIPVS